MAKPDRRIEVSMCTLKYLVELLTRVFINDSTSTLKVIDTNRVLHTHYVNGSPSELPPPLNRPH